MNIYISIALIILIIFIGLLSLIIYLFNLNRYYRLMLYHLKYFDYLYSMRPKLENAVISLTTTPKRLLNISETLKSLLDQSMQVEKIYLNIPYRLKKTGQPYIIPTYLQNLKSIEIVRCEDYGPATKLLPVLNKVKPDDMIIYLDDDNIYPYRLVENLVTGSKKYPNCAICIAGLQINRATHKTYKKIAMFDTKVDIVQGYAGVLVKPKYFCFDEIFDYFKAPKEFFTNDDFWISYQLTKYKIASIQLAFDAKNIPLATKNFFIDGLSTTVNSQNNAESILLQYWTKHLKN